MFKWRFNFADLVDFDGLVLKCLESVPQYCQTYPAPRADVSESLEEMISKGFQPRQNLVWHKTTHGQKRYYWIMKPNGNDEVRVKIGRGGVFGKADRDLRILTSTSECQKVVRQFLVRWEKSGVLPGWKTIWALFDTANYDISERRIKIIHKVLQDNVTREAFSGDDAAVTDIESINAQLLYGNNSDDDDNQNDEYVLEKDENRNSTCIQQPSSTNDIHRDQTASIPEPGHRRSVSSHTSDITTDDEDGNDDTTTTNSTLVQSTTAIITDTPTTPQITELSPVQHLQRNTIDSDKENAVVRQSANVVHAQQKSPNILTAPQTPPSESITQASDNKRKKQRRVYTPRPTPYATRQQKAIKTKPTQ